MSSSVKVLVQGVGNPSRGDDALGPAMIDRLMEVPLGVGIDCEWLYQLHVEQAEQWSAYDIVAIVDAHAKLEASFEWKELEPSTELMSFSSHQLSPEAVLGLNHKYFDRHPKVYLLALRAESFELGESMSAHAVHALHEGEKWLRRFLAIEGTVFPRPVS